MCALLLCVLQIVLQGNEEALAVLEGYFGPSPSRTPTGFDYSVSSRLGLTFVF